MVEHLLCKQGVIGSNPIVSTGACSLSCAGLLAAAVAGCGRFMGWFRHRPGWLAPESVGWRVGPCCRAGRLEGRRVLLCVLLLL